MNILLDLHPWIYLLFFYLITYFVRIQFQKNKINQLDNLNQLIFDFVNPLETSNIDLTQIYDEDQYEFTLRKFLDEKILVELLNQMPLIKKFLKKKSFSPLFHGQSYTMHYDKICNIGNRLLDTRAVLNFELKQLYNPINHLIFLVDYIFKLPSKFITYIGFSPSNKSAGLFNFFSWLIPILATIFSNEIKGFIFSLF